MTEDIAFPAGLPENCRNCPGLQGNLLAWRTLGSMSDAALQSASLSDEDMMSMLPDEVMALVGERMGESLDPGLESDRLRAVNHIRGCNGEAFTTMEQAAEEMAAAMVSRTELCGQKGPLKVRVPSGAGAVILRICRGDLADTHDGHDHMAAVSMQRDM